jgi:hypothetical protein
MNIEGSLKATLTQLQLVLMGLSDEEYGRPLPVLSNASVGQHTRHIIEFFQALDNDYESGVINYDKRKRDHALEANREQAQQALSSILGNIFRLDKEIFLFGTYSNEAPNPVAVRSTYYRELVYNLEHAVHHMAMIKIGIRQSTSLSVPVDFGVAAATLQYRSSIL